MGQQPTHALQHSNIIGETLISSSRAWGWLHHAAVMHSDGRQMFDARARAAGLAVVLL
jgi:hypothetical protein